MQCLLGRLKEKGAEDRKTSAFTLLAWHLLIFISLAYSGRSASVNLKGRGKINSLLHGKGSEMSSLVKLLWFCFAIRVQHFGHSNKLYFEKQSILLWHLAASHSLL